MRVTVLKRSTSGSVRLPRISSWPALRFVTTYERSSSEPKHLSKSTSDSTNRCSRPIEKNELPSRGLRRIEMSRICGSATARDQKPHRASAPPLAYTSELQTPTEEPITRSGTIPSSSSRLRQPAWYAPREAPPPRMKAVRRFLGGIKL